MVFTAVVGNHSARSSRPNGFTQTPCQPSCRR
jgi:hypothetical protein